MNYQWFRVNKQNPCVICGRIDWDTYCPELHLACCMRVQSDRPSANGGWFHNDVKKRVIPVQTYKPIDQFHAAKYWEWQRINGAPVEAQRYIRSLGPDPLCFYRLGMAWAAEYKAWAFPMKDGEENIIGVQLRYPDGHKRAVKGSRNGLFIPEQPASKFAIVCEGASDTAAALSLGYYAVGRQSCAAQSEMLNALIERKGISQVALIYDNDDPGITGGKRLAETLKVPYCVIIPPAKDLREFVQLGADRPMIEDMIHHAITNRNEQKETR
jgi:hypothetical protein